MTENIIEERQMDNGAQLKIIDQSRKIAGDRWFVKVSCQAIVPVTDKLYPTQEDHLLLQKIKDAMGHEMTFVIDKERIFVAEEDKEEVLNLLVAQINENMLAYLQSEALPSRLFGKRYEELRKKCLFQLQNPSAEDDEEDEEDDGPADFSACFRD